MGMLSFEGASFSFPRIGQTELDNSLVSKSAYSAH